MSVARARATVKGGVRPAIRPPIAFGAAVFEDGIHYDATINPELGGFMALKVPGLAARVGVLTDFFTFTRGSGGTYRGRDGLLKTAANNVPRIEFDANGNVLGLLIEGARTNLSVAPEDLSNVAYTKSGATVSADATAAPDGAQTADKLVESSGGTFHLVRQDIAVVANTPHTFVSFLAPAGRGFARLQLSNTAENSGAFVDINLTTGATGAVTTFGTGSAATIAVTSWANGFWRIALTCTIDAASVTAREQILLASALGTVNYAGDGASGIYVWGNQLEAGSFASSYTTGARSADVCARTFGGELLTSVGSEFFEFSFPVLLSAVTGTRKIFANDANGYTYVNVANDQMQVFDGTQNVFSNTFSPSVNSGSVNVRHRMACGYSGATMSAFADGGAGGSSAFDGTKGAGATVTIGSDGGVSAFYGNIRRLSYWPERKPDSFLKQRTVA